MNKFDSMLQYFKLNQPGYSQLVAADFAFELLTRIWVIAEVAEAFRNQIPMSIQFYTPAIEMLRSHLHHLDVREAQASRPEDCQLILDKIADKDAFNKIVVMAIMKPGAMTFVAANVDAVHKNWRMVEMMSKHDSDEDDKMPLYIAARNMDMSEFDAAVTGASDIEQVMDIYQASAVAPVADWGDINGLVRAHIMRQCSIFDPWAFDHATTVGQDGMATNAYPGSDMGFFLRFRAQLDQQQVTDVGGLHALGAMVKSRHPVVAIVAVTGPSEVFDQLRQASAMVAREPLPPGFECTDHLIDECQDMQMEWSYHGFGLIYLYAHAEGTPKATMHCGVADVTEYTGQIQNTAELKQFILASVCPKFGSFHEVNRLYYFREASRGFLGVWFGPTREGRAKASSLAPIFQRAAEEFGIPSAYFDWHPDFKTDMRTECWPEDTAKDIYDNHDTPCLALFLGDHRPNAAVVFKAGPFESICAQLRTGELVGQEAEAALRQAVSKYSPDSDTEEELQCFRKPLDTETFSFNELKEFIESACAGSLEGRNCESPLSSPTRGSW